MKMNGLVYLTLLLLTFGFLYVNGQSSCDDVLVFPAVARPRPAFDCAGNNGSAWNGECFLIVDLVSRETETLPYRWVSNRCPSGFHPANIYSQDHYNMLLTYIRPMIPAGWANLKLWTGMKYNTFSNTAQFYNGSFASFTEWLGGHPGAENANILIGLLVDPTPADPQGMITSPIITTFERHAMLCETGDEMEVFPAPATAPPQGSCTAPSFDFGGICYSLMITANTENDEITFAQAQTMCASAAVADITSGGHYVLVTGIIRANIPAGFSNLKIWLAMTYDYGDNALKLSDGAPAPYANWFPGRPGTDSSRTNIGLFITLDASSNSQGMFTTTPSGNPQRHGVLCQQNI